MRYIVCCMVFLGGAIAAATPAHAAICNAVPGGGGSTQCGGSPPPPPPPPPPRPPAEQNRLAGPDGNPIPNQNRCGDNQISVADCPAYQNLARFTYGCINQTEYAYAQAHSIAPLCSELNRSQYIGFCYCGCLEQSTGILVADPASGRSSVRRIDEITAGAIQVHALSDDATLSSMRLAPREVEATTAGPEKEPLVVLQLEDGTMLGASSQHAILLATGEMVAAKELRLGQQLVKQDGAPVAITQITRSQTDDDVFNVLTDAGFEHKGHMIVANGIIVGDLMWQNTLVKDLHSVVVRQ